MIAGRKRGAKLNICLITVRIQLFAEGKMDAFMQKEKYYLLFDTVKLLIKQ